KKLRSQYTVDGHTNITGDIQFGALYDIKPMKGIYRNPSYLNHIVGRQNPLNTVFYTNTAECHFALVLQVKGILRIDKQYCFFHAGIEQKGKRDTIDSQRH